MPVMVVQRFVEFQVTDKTPITLQKTNTTGQFDKTFKILLHYLPIYSTARNNLFMTLTRNSSKTLIEILQQNLKVLGVVVFRVSLEKQMYVVQFNHH